MSSHRWADYHNQGNLAYEQRISKELRAVDRGDELWLSQGRNAPKGSAGSDAGSTRSRTSTTPTAAVEQRLRRIEERLAEEKQGREEVKAQLDRLQALLVAQLARQQ
jgi:hypothetical protein